MIFCSLCLECSSLQIFSWLTLSPPPKLYSNVTFSMTSFLTTFSKLQSYTHIPCIPFSALYFSSTLITIQSKLDNIGIGALTLRTLENPHIGTTLVVQWLRLHAPNAGGPGSIPGWGTRSRMPQLRVHMPQLKILQATTKDPAGHNKDPVQPNNLKNKRKSTL